MACSSGVGVLKASDGSVVHSSRAKAELLNAVGTHDNGVLPDSLVTDDVSLGNIDCLSLIHI